MNSFFKAVWGKRLYECEQSKFYNVYNGMKPFLYGGVWFYPVASRPARKTFNAIDKLIKYDNWCKDFSNSLHYDWNDFYKEAKEQGYAKCDVFACRLDGKIHYFIPTGRMLAHFPMYNAFKHSSRDMKLLENELTTFSTVLKCKTNITFMSTINLLQD